MDDKNLIFTVYIYIFHRLFYLDRLLLPFGILMEDYMR